MHPGPIVPYVLSRQHEHRSGLIWSGDRETCYTDLQLLDRSYRETTWFAVVSQPLFRIQGEEGTIGSRASIHWFRDRHDLILRARGFIFLLIGRHMLPDFSGNLVHVRYLNLLEDFDAIRT
ncbi:hypothetical protein M9H77_24218 [Catharanthus roseus]|uniref:Uncharacterized protein n=1 Tax=Catharanthus roseus TaxID=4058 RepID=A0ACC0AX89_CATRO|nr:hypothetical protein M9H77_24218 [Catharanthus roseus]